MRAVSAAAAAAAAGVTGGIGVTRVGRRDAVRAVRRERDAVTGEPDAANALDTEAAVPGADVLGIQVDETGQRALDLDTSLAESVRADADLVGRRRHDGLADRCCTPPRAIAAGMIRPRGSRVNETSAPATGFPRMSRMTSTQNASFADFGDAVEALAGQLEHVLRQRVAEARSVERELVRVERLGADRRRAEQCGRRADLAEVAATVRVRRQRCADVRQELQDRLTVLIRVHGRRVECRSARGMKPAALCWIWPARHRRRGSG